MAQTWSALDHKGLDTTLGLEGQQGSPEVDGTSGVGRRPHYRREPAQLLANPPGSRIGEQDQDFLASLDDEVFLHRYVARVGNNDRERLRRTIRRVEAE